MNTKIHESIEEWMAGALCGALDGEEQGQFERHLAECEACRSLYREEQHMNTILEKQFAEQRPGPGFDERIVRRFRDQARSGRAGAWAGLAWLAQSRALQAAFALLLLAAMVKTGSMLTGERIPLASYRQVAALGDLPKGDDSPADQAHLPVVIQPVSHGIYRSALVASGGAVRRLSGLNTYAGATRVEVGGMTLASKDGADGGARAASGPARDMDLADAAGKKMAPMENAKTFAYDATGSAAEAPGGPVQAQEAPPLTGPETGRKLIRNGNVSYEVPDFAKASDRVAELTRQAQGYIATQDSERGENGKLRGSIVVKIPPPGLDAFLLQLHTLGDLKSQTLGTEDVTKTYFDTDARMKNAQEEEARLQDILRNKTGRLSDVLQVERELARVRQQIEEMQGTLKYYDTMVQYATVTIALAEKDLNETAQYLLKQRVDLSIFSPDVEATLARAKEEAAAVKAQTVDSNVQRDPDGRETATLSLLIDPAAADAAIAQLKTLGRIQNFNSQTERVSQGGSKPSDAARTEKDKVELHLTVLQDQETSVQQTNVTISTGDVEEKIAQLKKDAAAGGAEVKEASFQRDPSGAETGNVRLRLPLKNYPAVLEAVKALGEVKELSVSRQENAVATDTAPAEISVRLHHAGEIVTPDNGLWATVRKTLAEGFGAVMWSVRMIGVSLAFFAPWLIVLGVAAWIARRVLRRAK